MRVGRGARRVISVRSPIPFPSPAPPGNESQRSACQHCLIASHCPLFPFKFLNVWDIESGIWFPHRGLLCSIHSISAASDSSSSFTITCAATAYITVVGQHALPRRLQSSIFLISIFPTTCLPPTAAIKLVQTPPSPVSPPLRRNHCSRWEIKQELAVRSSWKMACG
jgi:hypothetical protein